MSGITPADAGKTIAIDMLTLADEDHPRGCGENEARHRQGSCPSGSPPRMRGKPDTPTVEDAVQGITPADAGKTQLATNPTDMRQDHPRGCGENHSRSSIFLSWIGSPPRMRGKLSFCVFMCPPHGITPADAGKTYRYTVTIC